MIYTIKKEVSSILNEMRNEDYEIYYMQPKELEGWAMHLQSYLGNKNVRIVYDEILDKLVEDEKFEEELLTLQYSDITKWNELLN